MDFRDRLKLLRKKAKLTQKQVASELGISERSYQDLEYGKNDPSYETLVKLCQVLNCDANYILGLNELQEALNEMVLSQAKYVKKVMESISQLISNDFLQNFNIEFTRLNELLNSQNLAKPANPTDSELTDNPKRGD